MAKSFSLGKVELVASTETAEAPAERAPGMPFHIAVIGDFSGRASRDGVEAGRGMAGRRPHRIDRDDFDRVMAGLGVELRLPVLGAGDARIVLRFRELEDFHPDRIYEQAEVFRALRGLRQRLKDPATFDATLKQMGIGGGPSPE